MENPYKGEWQKLKSIAENIQKAVQQESQLRSQLSSLQSQLSSLSYDPDDEGNDRNEAARNAVYAQINAVSQRLSQVQGVRQSLQSTAQQMASSYSQLASSYQQKSSSHAGAASTFQQLSGFRFGASTASAAASAASQRSTHYSDHVNALNELAQAASQATAGSVVAGGNSTISDRGTFQDPGLHKGRAAGRTRTRGYYADSGSSASNGQMHWSGKPGESVRQTSNSTNASMLAGVGASGIPYKNNTPNFDSVSHAKVQMNPAQAGTIEAMDAALARQTGISTEEAAEYRRDNNLVWRADETGQQFHLIPESIDQEYSEKPTSMQTLTPWQALMAYMSSHNYGRDDFVIYSQDPEWQRLHKAVFPDFHGETNPESREKLDSYMQKMGYDRNDYRTYGKDPEWQRLYREAYPNYRINYHDLVSAGVISGAFSELIQYTNYKDKPNVVNRPEFDEAVKKTGIVMFRTIQDDEEMGKTAKEFKNQLTNGDAKTFKHNGSGNRGYGDGAYFVINSNIERNVYPSQGCLERARDHSIEVYGKKGPGKRVTVSSTFARDVKLVSGHKLLEDFSALPVEEQRKYYDSTSGKYIYNYNGLSSYAIANGADGIIWEFDYRGFNYVTVLNRKKMIILEDPDNTAFGIT